MTNTLLREVIVAGYRWHLPIGTESVDHQNLLHWRRRSDAVHVFVRGRGLRSKQQMLDGVMIATAPLGRVPLLGLVAFASWAVVRISRLPSEGMMRQHASDPLGSVVGRAAAWVRRPSTRVVHVQGPYFDPPRALGWRGRLHSMLQVWGSRGATVVRVGDRDAADAAERVGIPRNRVALAWPVTPVGGFATGPLAAASAENLVLHAGSLAPRKGVDLVISALAKLPSEKQPKLVVAGVGSEDRRLREMAARLGVEALFLGHVPHDELPTLMRQCPIFVLASLSDAAPRAVMEAMAAGAAVVTTGVGDLARLVGDAGVVVEPDVARLADAIAELIAGRDARVSMGQRARQRALELFDPDRAFDTLWRLGLPAGYE